MPQVGTEGLIRVLIVDDAAESRYTLRRALAFDDALEVVGEAGSGQEAVEKADELSPTVVLMDVRMPDGNGVEATRTISSRRPDTRVVALTMHEDAETVREMLAAGASGYVVKGAPIDDLIAAVKGAAEGAGPIDARVLPHALDELRRLLSEEQDRRNEAEHLSQIREEFVHVLAHELRTPLTVMSGVLQLFRGQLKGDGAELVEAAIRRAGDLEHLIQGLELMGEGRPKGAAAEPQRVVEVALRRLEGRPDRVVAEAGAWRGISEAHLARICHELIGNAIRHGTRPIEVRAFSRAGEGVVQVWDAGDFHPDPALFRPFVQSDMSTTRERMGLGLGLFVAVRLCEAAGGQLDIRREEGRTLAEARFPLD